MNETIIKFIDYANQQGSRESYRYKRAFHRMIYIALGLDRFKNIIDLNLGENLTGKEEAFLLTAQHICSTAIQTGMDLGLHYKGKGGVFELSKEKVQEFAGMIIPAKPKKNTGAQKKPEAEIIRFRQRV